MLRNCSSLKEQCIRGVQQQNYETENWYLSIPEGGTGGSSTKLVAGIGRFSCPPEMSSQTKLPK